MPVEPLPLIRRTTPARSEKVLQFGTGRFLRAFADFFVDRANRAGLFGGSIVVVQSTGRSAAQALNAQGGCYTLWTRDQGGERFVVVSAVSRALAANEDWDRVLALARSEDLGLVLSNTTEVGLALHADDDLYGNPPRSFPAKLTAVLYARAQHFNFDPARGLVVLPCELIDNNGSVLRALVETAARRAKLDEAFLPWLARSTAFCNTLVDRIVPGSPPKDEHRIIEQQLGYSDPLLITAEGYRLWAIEGGDALRKRIGFADTDPGIVIAPDITPFRLRKIRLLNGGHTLTVPLGLLAGNRTVLDNVTNPVTAPFIKALLRQEIGPTLDVDPATIGPYIDEVLDRWRNPHLVHRLIDITLQSTTKMRHRVVPTIAACYARLGTAPRRIALGFASYLLFMRGEIQEGGTIYTAWQGTRHVVRDDEAAFMRDAWQKHPAPEDLAAYVCSNVRLWGFDLDALPLWTDTVAGCMQRLISGGVEAAIGHIEGAFS